MLRYAAAMHIRLRPVNCFVPYDQKSTRSWSKARRTIVTENKKEALCCRLCWQRHAFCAVTCCAVTEDVGSNLSNAITTTPDSGHRYCLCRCTLPFNCTKYSDLANNYLMQQNEPSPDLQCRRCHFWQLHPLASRLEEHKFICDLKHVV